MSGVCFPAVSIRKFLMLLSIFLLAIILLVASIVLYYDASSSLNEQTEEIGSVKCRQYMEYVDGNFIDLNKLTGYMAKDESLKKILFKKCNSIMDRIYRKTQMEAQFARLVSYYDVISSINVVSSDGEHFYYGKIVFSRKLADSLGTSNISGVEYNIKNFAQVTANISSQTPFSIDSLDNYMYIHFKLYENTEKACDVWVILNHKLFFRNNDDMLNTALLNSKGVIYDGIKLDEEDRKKVDAAVYMKDNKVEQVVGDARIYSKIFQTAGITALYMVDASEYIKKLHSIKVFVCLIYFSSLIIAAVASGYISGRIIRPVDEMNRLMNSYNLEGVSEFTGREKFKKAFSMREKIFYYMLITILAPSAFYIFVMLLYSSSIMSEMIINSRESVFFNTSIQLNRIFENKIDILQKLSFDSSVQNYLMNDLQGNTDSLNDLVEDMRYLGLDRDSVTIYDKNARVVFCDRYKSDEKLKENNLYSFEGTSSLGVSYNVNTDYIGDEYITILMPVICLEEGKQKSEKIGFCRIDCEYYRIRQVLDILDGVGCTADIVSAKGSFIFNSSGQKFDKLPVMEGKEEKSHIVLQNVNYMLYSARLLGTPWYAAAWSDIRDIKQQSIWMLGNYIYLFIVILLVTILISHFISMNLLKPIIKLNNLFKSFDIYGECPESGNYFEKNYYINEINSMGENFSRMADRIETLIDDLIIANNEKNRIELERKSAEITALQAQINPHFLYNTLNNIIALIRTGSDEEAILTVKLLSILFKYGISREEIVIPIREEIEYARAYTKIMQIRHKDRITFEWEIDDRTLDCLTVKLILQPLIENSIRHGFNNPEKHGIVFVRCKMDEGSVLFEVEDNGTGMLREEAEELVKRLSAGKYGNNIGIFNVQSRIKLHYGKEYGLEFSSEYGKGTLVSVRIPIKIK